jgi:hypothetical protein
MVASLSDVSRLPGSAWDQGDVVDALYFAALDALRPAVLVTPACDLEHDKVDLWTFVVLYPDVDIARTLVAKDLASWQKTAGQLSRGQQEALTKKVRELIAHRFGRYHWIPVKIGEHPAHVADFSCVTSLPAGEVQGTARRIASMASSWREQLPARYASYMARVGTVDFDRAEIEPQVDRLVRSLAGG